MIRIKELRESRGLQQKELSIDLGVSQPTVSDWESGRKVPSAKSTILLADYFGVSTDYLLGRDEKKPAPVSEDGLEEMQLMKLYRNLNKEGREKLLDYADDLVTSGKYIKTHSPVLDQRQA